MPDLGAEIGAGDLVEGENAWCAPLRAPSCPSYVLRPRHQPPEPSTSSLSRLPNPRACLHRLGLGY